MRVIETTLPGVLLVEPKTYGDARGYLFEAWRADVYADAGAKRMVQDNVSLSSRGVLRGLHLQYPRMQGKLVMALQGEVFDVAVDVRVGSPHFGRWTAALLSVENHRQLWIPEGFAHGFCVLSEKALFAYKCTDYYAPEHELTIAWNDPEIGVDWPLVEPNLSARDACAPCLARIDRGRLPRYAGP